MERFFKSYPSALSAITPETGFHKILRFDRCTDATGRNYLLKFVFSSEHSPFLRIDSETHRTLLTKGTEKEATRELKRFGWKIRSITGGYFCITAFDGVVFGTVNPSIAKGFYRSIEPDSTMSMLIYLTDHPVPVVVQDTFNRENRSLAVKDSLGTAWDAEDKKYNPQFRIQKNMPLPPKAMEITICGLSGVFGQIEKEMRVSLGETAIIIDPKVDSVEVCPVILPVASKTP